MSNHDVWSKISVVYTQYSDKTSFSGTPPTQAEMGSKPKLLIMIHSRWRFPHSIKYLIILVLSLSLSFWPDGRVSEELHGPYAAPVPEPRAQGAVSL